MQFSLRSMIIFATLAAVMLSLYATGGGNAVFIAVVLGGLNGFWLALVAAAVFRCNPGPVLAWAIVGSTVALLASLTIGSIDRTRIES